MNKNGRPLRDSYLEHLCGDGGVVAAECGEDYEAGWRREHAGRSWSAMAALVMVATAWNAGAMYYLVGGPCLVEP